MNACHVPATLPASCPTKLSPLGYILVAGTSGEECYLLSENGDKPTLRTKWTITSIATPKALAQTFNAIVEKVTTGVKRILAMDTEKDHEHIKIIGSPDGIKLTGTSIGNSGLTYNVDISMNCAQSNTGISNLKATYDSATTKYNISFDHQNACGYDLFGWWNKIGDWKYVIGGVAAFICTAMAIFGWKLFKPSVALIGFIGGVLVTYIFLNMFWDSYDSDSRLWTFIGIAVVVGVILALVLFYCFKVAVFGSGAFLGITLGFELYELVIYKLEGGQNNVWLYVTVIGMGVICAVISIWLEDEIIILATAWGGSYIAVKMVGVMAGNYPDETMIAEEIASGELSGLPKWGYIYLAIMAVMGISCTIFQCVKMRKEKKEKDEKKQQEGGYQNIDTQGH